MASSSTLDLLGLPTGANPLILNAFLLGGLLAAGLSVLALYRLYFHPLAKFPGVKSAAISNDWIGRVSHTGHAEERLAELHSKYDTKALRIGPNELHLTDTHLYKLIYNQISPFPKHPGFYKSFNTPHNLFAELDENVHRSKRRLVNPYFARNVMIQLEPMIIGKLRSLEKRIEAIGVSKPVNVDAAFRCCTLDIISEFAFGKSLDLLSKTDDNFYQGFLSAFDILNEMIWERVYSPIKNDLSYRFPFLTALGRALPPVYREAGLAVQEYHKQDKKPEHPVIFDAFTDMPNLAAVDESILFLAAGTDTTAFTLSSAWCQILQNPDILAKLKGELKTLIPDKNAMPPLPRLDEMKYLRACVKEALRYSMPVEGRLPRVVPADLRTPLVVDDKVVPPGTIVSMSAYTMHHSEELWGPRPEDFNPERWLMEGTPASEANMVSFSKGKRACLGQNLATTELTIFMAHLFRQYDMELVSGAENVANSTDYFTKVVEKPGMRIRFTPTED